MMRRKRRDPTRTFVIVCDEMVRQVELADGIYPRDATAILALLIGVLLEQGWREADEVAARYREKAFVAQAFAEHIIV